MLNWREKLDYVYVLTFYIETTLYHLKELDRQELFEFLSPSAEEHGLDMREADEKERVYIYRNYFKGGGKGWWMLWVMILSNLNGVTKLSNQFMLMASGVMLKALYIKKNTMPKYQIAIST